MRRGRPKGGPQTAVRSSQFAVAAIYGLQAPLRTFGPHLLAGEA